MLLEHEGEKIKKESVKMKKNKGLIVLICLLLAVAVILCSCGQAEKEPGQKVEGEVPPQEEQTDDEPSEKDEGYSLPIADEPVTLTFMCRENQIASAPTYGSGELPVWQKAEELTGVKIEWETAISSDYEAVVQTRLAAGVDLPDMVCVPDPLPYLPQELFISLDDLIEKYAPDVKKMLEENPDVKASVTAYDGKIYCVTQVPKEVNEVHTRMLWIREDWLDRLELKMPETIDDWYKVLKAFKEEDANGNGDKGDEFPMISQGPNEIGNRGLAAAFDIVYAYTDGYSVDKNGKVRLDWMRPEAKEYMTFIKKLIDEQLFVMVDNNERDMRLADDTAGSIDHWPDAIQGRNNLLRQEVPDGRFVACPAPSSQFGEGFYVTPHPSYGYETGIFITKECDEPQVAMKWINFLFSPEGYLLTNFGIEGESYTMEDGKPKVTEYFTKNPDGLSSGEAQRFLGGRPSFANFMSQDFEVQVKMIDPFIGPSVDILKKYGKQPPFPQVMATVDEIDVLKTIGTDLQTYVDENKDMFMLGERPLEEFDAFVQEVAEMGLDEVLIIKQQQYERYKEFSGQ
jgi:putative aldouronate transport system substrate-binding protein